MDSNTVKKNISTDSLEKSWPQYKIEAPLPPELMNLTLSFLEQTRKTYWDNDQLKEEIIIVNEKIHGEWKLWDRNGKIWEKGYFINGIQDGLWEKWQPNNGQILERGKYVNGKKHGEWKRWHKNGQLWMQGNYINGKKDGEFTWWYEDGTIIKQKSY